MTRDIENCQTRHILVFDFSLIMPSTMCIRQMDLESLLIRLCLKMRLLSCSFLMLTRRCNSNMQYFEADSPWVICLKKIVGIFMYVQ